MNTMKNLLIAGMVMVFCSAGRDAFAGNYNLFPMFSSPVGSFSGYTVPTWSSTGYQYQASQAVSPWLRPPVYPAYQFGYSGYTAPYYGAPSYPAANYAAPPGVGWPVYNYRPVQNPVFPPNSSPTQVVPAGEAGNRGNSGSKESLTGRDNRKLRETGLESPFYP